MPLFPSFKSSFKVIWFCTFVAFGGFLFGYDIGVISSCLTMPDFIERFGDPDGQGGYVLSVATASEITALLSAGTFFGSIFQAFVGDRLGRKLSIFSWSALFTVGAVIQTAAMTSVPQLVAGRFIAGLGVGALSALVPLYNSEAAPRGLRGFLVVLYQLQITLGLFFAYIIDTATHQIPGSASWRVPVGLQVAIGIFLCSGILFLPESPRLLVGRGDTLGARKSIAAVNDCPLDDPEVEATLNELTVALAAENKHGKAGWMELFSRNHSLWKRTLNACMLQFVQQLNGQNFYYYYGPTFFAQSNTNLGSYGIQLMLGGVTFAATIPALYLIEKMGRRSMLLTGCVTEAICAAIAGLCGHFMLAPDGTPRAELTERNLTGGALLVAFAVIQISCFACFWGPTPWLYSAESFPLRVRSKGMAIATATNWFWNFMVGWFASKIAAQIGPLICLIFAGMMIYGGIWIYFMVPETKGLSLEEVDELYANEVKPWESTSWVPPSRSANKMTKVNEEGETVQKEETVHKETIKEKTNVFGH